MFYEVGENKALDIGFLPHVVPHRLDNLDEGLGVDATRCGVHRVTVNQRRVVPALGKFPLGQDGVAIGSQVGGDTTVDHGFGFFDVVPRWRANIDVGDHDVLYRLFIEDRLIELVGIGGRVVTTARRICAPGQ